MDYAVDLRDADFSRAFEASFNNVHAMTDFQVYFCNTGRTVHVHKFILAMNSDFFYTCFSSSTESIEWTDSRYVIDEDDETLMVELLRSFYSSRIRIPSVTDAVPLLLLAGKYGCQSKERVLLRYLCSNLCAFNVIKCWMFLDFKEPKYQELLSKSEEFISQNSHEILTSGYFADMHVEPFKLLLACASNQASSEVVLEAIQRWVDFGENRSQYLYMLVKLLNDTRRQGSPMKTSPYVF
jgi:hypothetical protein